VVGWSGGGGLGGGFPPPTHLRILIGW